MGSGLLRTSAQEVISDCYGGFFLHVSPHVAKYLNYLVNVFTILIECRFLSFFFYFFFFWAVPHGLRDLSSPTRDQTRALAVRAQSPNHWTTMEVPRFLEDKDFAL